MAKQVLFVQGGAEGAYKDDARLAESLRSNLGPNYQVRYPAMPNEADPDYQSWKRSILRGVQEWERAPSSWDIRSGLRS
jgi:hypothetical protein